MGVGVPIIVPNITYYFKPFLLPCWHVLIHIDLQLQMGLHCYYLCFIIIIIIPLTIPHHHTSHSLPVSADYYNHYTTIHNQVWTMLMSYMTTLYILRDIT